MSLEDSKKKKSYSNVAPVPPVAVKSYNTDKHKEKFYQGTYKHKKKFYQGTYK
tara:strand:+ start:65 stop:223 length:159 start_codon:yes stop_codon:yes gene_type:complete